MKFQAIAGLHLLALGAGACSPDVLTIESPPGSGQRSPEGTPGWVLDDSLEVRVTDGANRPRAGVPVVWRTTEPGALVRPDTTWTDHAGRARSSYVPGWRLGDQRVEASAEGRTTALTVRATGLRLRETAYFQREVLCGLDLDDRLWCFPPYRGGRPVPLPNHHRPIPVAHDTRFRHLRSTDLPLGGEEEAMCAVSHAGDLWCARGADGETHSSSGLTVPVLRRLATPFQVRDVELGGGWSGTGFQCAIDTADRVWCRGNNREGALGDGTQVSRATWAPVASTERFQALTLSSSTTCGLTLEGAVYCWGYAESFLGRRQQFRPVTTPEPVPWPALRYARISHAASGICGVSTLGGGQLLCWGPVFPTPTVDSTRPSSLDGLPAAASSVGGDAQGGRFTSGGRLYLFGYDADVGSDAEYRGANRLAPEPTGVVAVISRNSPHWCVTHEGGAVICSSMFKHPVGVPLPAPTAP